MIILFSIIAIVGLGGMSANKIPTKEELVSSSKSQLMNQYKRRQDLIPQLVNTVKGAANFEKNLMTDVVETRQQVMNLDVSPANMNQYIKKQDQLTSALSRLLVTVERYPDVKSVEAFITLQAQLEGTENRIAVTRKDFIQAIKDFNIEIKTMPGVIWNKMIFKRDAMPQLTQSPSTENPVEVNFTTKG